ncbi:MFS transporter [Streptomyces sp. SS7]|uniref:MFS transporter n=1 Tax=Streptomyces sp. SS7 TaxID=3108485 RepID=UPI0030EC6922
MPGPLDLPDLLPDFLPAFRPAAVAAACGAFALMGALQAFYGPAIPALREEFGLSPSATGPALSAHFVGGVVGVLLFDRLYGRIGNRRLLGCSYLLMATGAAGFALAPDWGAILGPALIGAVGADRHPTVFPALALVTLPLLRCLRGVRDHVPPQPGDTPGRPATAPARRALRSVLTVFVALYVLHVGIEAGVGGWEPTHLETAGYGAGIAATATSVCWLMMTAGRFLAAPLALRFSAQAIITVSCAGMTACLLPAAVPDLAPYAYAGVGLFIAPIFPTGLPRLHRAAPHARRAGALVIAASLAGGVAAGPSLGKVIEWSGVRAVPLLLAAVSALCLAATLWLTRATRTPARPSAPGPHPARSTSLRTEPHRRGTPCPP